ncbi:hypothetical protein [Haliea sp.]|jgi:hypothetical protein|uniref:hypothetical protein n=1 Tax=Haliea sp. TaxID=1932666 RepID=UPI000C5408A9|nr:hypothetical protein [Haliea sp.]MAD65693.1 hypothetical protein [Haliea sp.]|tara:strand:+ start:27361 stop:27558 length:198 start_codon:yes stop_codon:yes gene_type:complete
MDIEVSFFNGVVKGFVLLSAGWFIMSNLSAKYKRASAEKDWDGLASVVVRSLFLLSIVVLIVYFF